MRGKRPDGELFVYAENWPAHERIATTGLDRALVPIVDALAPWQPTVLLAPRALKSVRHPLHPTIKPVAVRPGLVAVALDELRTRRQRDYDGRGRRQDQLRRQVHGRAGWLLSVLGGDARAYMRAAKLAQGAGLQHVIYTVDDPFAWADERQALLPLLRTLKPAVADAMKNATTVLTITPGLAETLSNRLQRACYPLALPYMEPPATPTRLKRQLVYVGNMSHLYRDSFVQIVEAVARRRAAGNDLSMRVTFSPEALGGALDPIPDFVDFGRIDDRAEFLRTIANSLAAVCPIAFAPDQAMVRSSFPSKLLDYLGHARAIIVHSPPDSVASQYLAESELPYTTTTPQELDRALIAITDKAPDHRAAYRQLLDRAHGAIAFRETIRFALSVSPGD